MRVLEWRKCEKTNDLERNDKDPDWLPLDKAGAESVLMTEPVFNDALKSLHVRRSRPGTGHGFLFDEDSEAKGKWLLYWLNLKRTEDTFI